MIDRWDDHKFADTTRGAFRLLLDQVVGNPNSERSLEISDRENLLEEHRKNVDFRHAFEAMAAEAKLSVLEKKTDRIILGVLENRSPFASTPREFRSQTGSSTGGGNERNAVVQLIIHVVIASTYYPQSMSVGQSPPTASFSSEVFFNKIKSVLNRMGDENHEDHEEDLARHVIERMDEISASETDKSGSIDSLIKRTLKGYARQGWLYEEELDGVLAYQVRYSYHQYVTKLISKSLFLNFVDRLGARDDDLEIRYLSDVGDLDTSSDINSLSKVVEQEDNPLADILSENTFNTHE